ncbi:WGR domain-containing protein [Myxococcaceae bacterium GXIMD 01537]
MRRFEFVEGTSSKFWEPEVQGNIFIVTFGRIGTAGQRKEKAFPDEASAQREYEKKVAEKTREGYREVGAAPAPAREPKAPAAPKLEPLPRRAREVKPTAEQVAAAVAALTALQEALGTRSWRVTRQVRRARVALRALGGFDPATHPTMGPLFEALMGRVVAPKGEDRLPLRLAMVLLAELDVSAFIRGLQRWKQAPEGSASVVAREAEALGEPELALRMGVLLATRPGYRGSSEEGWGKRWTELKPHLEAHLKSAGHSLAEHLGTIDARGDTHLAKRVSRMGA